MVIKVFADLPKEYMYEAGIENGLTEKAANYFKYFNEVELNLSVDEKTGEVNDINVSESNFIKEN